jgi:hypothetical protein
MNVGIGLFIVYPCIICYWCLALLFTLFIIKIYGDGNVVIKMEPMEWGGRYVAPPPTWQNAIISAKSRLNIFTYFVNSPCVLFLCYLVYLFMLHNFSCDAWPSLGPKRCRRFCDKKHESSPLSIPEKHRRLCKKSRRIDWYHSWPHLFFGGTKSLTCKTKPSKITLQIHFHIPNCTKCYSW